MIPQVRFAGFELLNKSLVAKPYLPESTQDPIAIEAPSKTADVKTVDKIGRQIADV